MTKQYFGKWIDLSRICQVSDIEYFEGIYFAIHYQLIDSPVKIYVPSLEGDRNRHGPLDESGENCRLADSVWFKRIKPGYDTFIKDWKECKRIEKEAQASLFIIKEVVETARHIQEVLKDKDNR